jgi:hypothetical protein
VAGNAPLFLVGAKYDGLQEWRPVEHMACGLSGRSYITLTIKVSQSRNSPDGWALHSLRGESGSFPGGPSGTGAGVSLSFLRVSPHNHYSTIAPCLSSPANSCDTTQHIITSSV